MRRNVNVCPFSNEVDKNVIKKYRELNESNIELSPRQ